MFDPGVENTPIGVVLVANEVDVQVITKGVIDIPGLDLTPCGDVYGGHGVLTQTAPIWSGETVFRVGMALSNTLVYLDMPCRPIVTMG